MAQQRKVGDYFLVRKIATGGMAEIHLARTRTAQGGEKYVALKMIHPRYMEDGNFHRMIVEEAKIAVQLNHKNIGQVFDLGQVDGHYFIVMEYIDGYDLSRLQEVCQQKGLTVPIDVVAFVGREVCAALAYAHTRRDRSGQALNLIHRDISPQNILLSFDGDCKIIDFGIAKVSTRLQQTHAGVIKGKFYYMSPEQAGASEVDQRSDLFSLGICLWESLCGRSLFRREGGPTNPLAILHEIRTMPIPRVREVRRDCARELDDLVAKALARDITWRFQSAAEMQAAFNRFLINNAPSFTKQRLIDFMVTAFEKEETTKETNRVTTSMAELLQAGEFAPSQASVIFDAGNSVAQGSATQIFADPTPPPVVVRAPAESRPIAGESRIDVQERSTDQQVEQVHDAELAMSETVFLKKEDVEDMRKAGAAPQVVPAEGWQVADPNSRTQAIASSEIQAVHQAYQASVTSPGAVAPPKASRGFTRSRIPTPVPIVPLAQHRLFRLLVIAVLVLCLLTATLALLLVRRAREKARLSGQQHEQAAPAAKVEGRSLRGD